MRKRSYEMDMCSGPLVGKILLFALPLMLSSMLQLLFNAADIVVVGRFAGRHALAAVGATSALINLLVNLFVGLSVGVNVVAARYYGGKRDQDISDTVHTAVLMGLVSGLVLVALGFAVSLPVLTMMGTPEDVLSHAVLYMRIYFVGTPVLMLYNFGSAILRAVGDTRRPLYFLFLSGLVNVVLNLFFVLKLGMGVAGVGWATVISELLSAVLVLHSLMKIDGPLKLDLKKLKIHKKKLKQIVKVGLPAGLQSVIFALSNILIQSSVNSFGSVAMAGNTASSNIESFVNTATSAVYQTNLSFTSQNLGGGKYSRINRILLICLGVVVTLGFSLGICALTFGKGLLHLYSDDAEVIRYGMLRLSIIGGCYFLCGMMDTFAGSVRGLGYSMLPMFVSLAGACGFRVFWVFTVFREYHSLETLYISYPVSWVLTALIHMLVFIHIRKKIPKLDAVLSSSDGL